MEIVLRRNDKKKSWENCTYEYLLNGIERETKELRECFWYPDGRSELFGIVGDDFLVSNRFTEDQVLSECADVANFAMMVFDVLMQREYKNGCASHTSAPAPDTKVDNFKRLAEEHHKLCIEIHNFDNHIHDVIQKGIRICESKYEGEDSINCCNCGVPTTDDGEPDCNECAFSEQHDTAIRAEAAKAATENMLDAVIAWKRKHGYWFTVDSISGEKRYHFEPDRFEEFIESLRQQESKPAKAEAPANSRKE
jgi:hypothetical protein